MYSVDTRNKKIIIIINSLKSIFMFILTRQYDVTMQWILRIRVRYTIRGCPYNTLRIQVKGRAENLIKCDMVRESIVSYDVTSLAPFENNKNKQTLFITYCMMNFFQYRWKCKYQNVLLKELLRVFFLNPKTGNGHNEWLDESYIDDTFTEVRVTFLEGRKNAPIMTVIDTDFVLKSNQKHISVVHFMFCTTIRVHYNLMNRYKQWK